MLRMLSCFVIGIAVVGCDSGPTYVPVKGRVTFEGAPVQTGLVEFEAADGTRPSAKGGRITDGEYAAEVPAGDVIVKIRGFRVLGKRKMYDDANSPVTEVTEQFIPSKYNDESQLKEKITSKRDDLDFKLTK